MKYKLKYQINPDEYSKVCYGDTDSVFMILKTKSYRKFTELKGQDNELKNKLMEEAFSEGKKLADEISKELFKTPVKLEFEKVYYPLILFSKKRYIGNYYGKSPHTIDFTENKGIVLKRRDNPNIVKKLYKAFIDPILEQGKPGILPAVEFLKSEIVSIIENRNDLSDLIVTKAIGKGYDKERCHACDKPATRRSKADSFSCKNHSDPSDAPLNVYASENSPHIALCKKMAFRDPGSAPVSGDRINYVFVMIPGNPRAKLFEKAEDPVYAQENNLEIDVFYYINNQLKKPISELLQFLIDDSETFFDKIIEENRPREPKDNQRTIKFVGKMPYF
jgi:DNA polymerase delta subunit 1